MEVNDHVSGGLCGKGLSWQDWSVYSQHCHVNPLGERVVEKQFHVCLQTHATFETDGEVSPGFAVTIRF